MLNWPTLITLGRILCIPFYILVFYLPFKGSHFCAALIFSIAALSDYLDGYLARRFKQETPLGAFLDPVADKLMVATALVLIVGEKFMPYLALPAAIIIGREIVISALREWMAELGQRKKIAVSTIAKYKTAMQMIAIISLSLYKAPSEMLGPWLKLWHQSIMVIGYITLYSAAILTLWTMVQYLVAAWPDMRGQR